MSTTTETKITVTDEELEAAQVITGRWLMEHPEVTSLVMEKRIVNGLKEACVSASLAEQATHVSKSSYDALMAHAEAMEEALANFAEMNRDDSDYPDDHVVLSRGIASDLTLLTESDFRRAAKALSDFCSAYPKEETK